jgi:hypothetical protein
MAIDSKKLKFDHYYLFKQVGWQGCRGKESFVGRILKGGGWRFDFGRVTT